MKAEDKESSSVPHCTEIPQWWGQAVPCKGKERRVPYSPEPSALVKNDCKEKTMVLDNHLLIYHRHRTCSCAVYQVKHGKLHGGRCQDIEKEQMYISCIPTFDTAGRRGFPEGQMEN